jgi:aminoglycoside phosphotransferase (APT) family kinase protein
MPSGINTALESVFGGGGSPWGMPVSMRRRATPYVTTFPCEIVTCRFPDGGRLSLFCKYGAKDGMCSFGQRGGVAYEAEVYRRVLQPSGVSAPAFYGSHTDGSGGTWIVVEFLKRSARAGKISRLRAMKPAARWIGEFHAANEGRAGDASLAFLTDYHAQWYREWPRRAVRSARLLRLDLPWLRGVARRLEDEIATLAALPRTVIHGEYYPHNVMFQSGTVRPVDWETAALGAGEIDLAALTEGWGPAATREFEEEYKKGRWPAGAPADFARNLSLARAFMQLRWIGDDDPLKSADMVRWERLYEEIQRLQLLPRRGRPGDAGNGAAGSVAAKRRGAGRNLAASGKSSAAKREASLP